MINRVTKEAGFTPLREISFQGGSFADKRITVDLDQPLSDKVAFRLNGMYENSDRFRNYVSLERYGINPTLTFTPDKADEDHLGYELSMTTRVPIAAFHPFREDRSNSSVARSTEIPADSHVKAAVNIWDR